ncbi:MAG: SusC/RagA family TonB-linked outer membrane protein [Bacteroidales bacterium]
MRKIAFFFTILLFMGTLALNAQTRVITGKVTSSEDDMPVPGVSIVVQGTTLGTVTDMDGNYSLQVPQEAQNLIFSFVGMARQEIGIAGRSTINVVMQPQTIGVDEVVVTALGISRDKKSLGYSVQEVAGEDLNKVKTDNFVTSLSGKVAGVQIKNNTNFGGSSNIIIRGSSSLTQNNQALFVVDGVPVSNNLNNDAYQQVGGPGYDYGNAASDINQNDIESVSVLKGAAATALYGSRAANGVVLITTKKGKRTDKKTMGISVNSNVTVSSIDMSTFPKHQTKYGAGYGPYYSGGDYPGLYEYDWNGDGVDDLIVPTTEDASRGQAFDPNLMVYHYDAFVPESEYFGQPRPFVAGKNGADTFFETGVKYTNSIDIAGGSENGTYRFAYTNQDITGVMPNSSLKKNNYILNASYDILKNLTISTSANYINTQGKGRPSTGYNDNIMSMFRQWYDVGVDIKQQEDLYFLTGRNVTWNQKSPSNTDPIYWDNPYWTKYENYQTDQRNRLIGYVQADLKITDALSVMGRAAIDTYNELLEERRAVGSVASPFGVGYPDVQSGYLRRTRAFTETNVDFMFKYNKVITDDLNINALLGTNIRRTTEDNIAVSTNGGLAVPEVYALSNSVDPMLPPDEALNEIGVNGYFGSVSLGYRDMLYVDATARVDQSSTLPEDNNTNFYPSISGSFVFSELVDADWLSNGKLRLNYAEVGNSAPARRTKNTYIGNAPLYGNSLVTVPDTRNNPDLKPETQKALEGGLEMNFFRNRLGFDLALYKNNTMDQLMPVTVSNATGYDSKWVNAGEIENKGVELALYGTPVRTRDFSWDISLNWAKNSNEVIELFIDEAGNEVKNLQIAGLQGGVTINARVGEPYGTIHGPDFVYHENGQRIVEDGYYERSSTNDQVIGNINPDFNAGLNNAFSYKNFTFSFLVDWQKGGDVFSLDLWYGIGTGLYEETANNNDLGNPQRDPVSEGGGLLLDGVNPDGTPNDTRIGSTYYAEGWASSPNARFVYDASYVKLRELVLTYNLPEKLMDKTFIKGASLSFVGSNLWIIHKNLPHADPEASQGAGNIQGWQSGVMPATNNYGFSLNIQL